MLSLLFMRLLYIYFMIQPLPEADHVFQTFQANFDRMLCDVLDKYCSCRGFTLLLGSILQFTNFQLPSSPYFPPGMVASLYLVRQKGEGHILDDTGLSGILSSNRELSGTGAFLTYFMDLLRNPGRSGTHTFDEQRYATATKECLELCLCSHHKFSMEAKKSTRLDKELLRNKPWAWKTRQGVHSGIRKTMHHLTVQRRKLLKLGRKVTDQFPVRPLSPSEHEDYQFLAYQWGLDILPFLLEKSAISLELADVLRTHTFAMMAQKSSPRKMKLAKAATTTYLLRVESVVGSP